MKKLPFSFFNYLFSGLIFFLITYYSTSSAGVVISNTADPEVLASDLANDISPKMIVDGSGGTSESSAYKAYIPLGGGGDVTYQNQTVLSDPTLLPQSPHFGSAFVQVALKVHNKADSARYLKAAVKTSDDYHVLDLNEDYSFGANSAETTVRVYFDLDDVCSSITGINCSGMDETTRGNNSGVLAVYYFLSETNLAEDDGDIDPESDAYKDGVFIKYNFSDKLPSGSLTIVNVYNGDERIIFEISGGASITQMGDKRYKLMSYFYPSSSAEQTAGGVVGSAGGEIHEYYTPMESGIIDIQGLVNNTTYNVALALVNKYQFHSPLSESKKKTPEPIEALLKQQKCFLLTAGFRGDHPVVRFFRDFRDQFLVHIPGGTSFIEFYYKEAPRWAPTIYQSPLISSLIRFMAYASYYALHILPLILLFLCAFGTIWAIWSKFRRI